MKQKLQSLFRHNILFLEHNRTGTVVGRKCPLYRNNSTHATTVFGKLRRKLININYIEAFNQENGIQSGSSRLLASWIGHLRNNKVGFSSFVGNESYKLQPLFTVVDHGSESTIFQSLAVQFQTVSIIQRLSICIIRGTLCHMNDSVKILGSR